MAYKLVEKFKCGVLILEVFLLDRVMTISDERGWRSYNDSVGNSG